MKRHITYIAMLLTALTGASCSQDETPAGDGRTGVMAMTISTSRAEDLSLIHISEPTRPY